jgi:hypothetical protein
VSERFIIRLMPKEQHKMAEVLAHCEDAALLDGFAESYARMYPDSRIVVADVVGCVVPEAADV